MKTVRLSTKITGQPQTTLAAIFEEQAVKKGNLIAADTSHCLTNQYELLPSGRRCRSLPLKTKRAMATFVPTSIRLLNKQQRHSNTVYYTFC